MSESIFDRTEKLIGADKVELLKGKTVAVFGLGGVGGYVCEALARAGVGHLVLIDKDEVNITNINRQIVALHSTIGMKKTDAFAKRLRDINPDIKLTLHDCFFLPENSSIIDFRELDYVADCVDTVTAKIEIIKKSKEAEVPVISSMGTGNKLDPGQFQIADISKTEVCPLAKVMRRELKERGIKKVKVLFSRELPVKTGLRTPASISFVPPVAGLMIAGEIVRDLIKD